MKNKQSAEKKSDATPMPMAGETSEIIDFPQEEAKMITATFSFREHDFHYTVLKNTTIAHVLQNAGTEMMVPDKAIFSVDGIPMDGDYVVRNNEIVKVRLAEAMYGATTIDVTEYIGRKIGVVINECGGLLNLPVDEKLIIEIQDKSISLSYLLMIGDRLEFTKKAGRKL